MTRASYRRTIIAMDTFVTIEVPGHDANDEAVEPAFAWFAEIESHCSRFDPQSELRQLIGHAGETIPVSVVLFEAVRFSLALAEQTDGAFDPTVGRSMEKQGFNREYQTGKYIDSGINTESPVSFRDVILDPERLTITLKRPLVLDLGAVAKGLAVDLAARELLKFRNYMVDAGGDVYLAGHNAAGTSWNVGIPDPRHEGQLLHTIPVSNAAVCTSGDYERGKHIIDARTNKPITGVASATVIAPTAMLADGLATAAFVLGPEAGLELLETAEVQGLIVTSELEQFTTRGFPA